MTSRQLRRARERAEAKARARETKAGNRGAAPAAPQFTGWGGYPAGVVVRLEPGNSGEEYGSQAAAYIGSRTCEVEETPHCHGTFIVGAPECELEYECEAPGGPHTWAFVLPEQEYTGETQPLVSAAPDMPHATVTTVTPDNIEEVLAKFVGSADTPPGFVSCHGAEVTHADGFVECDVGPQCMSPDDFHAMGYSCSMSALGMGNGVGSLQHECEDCRPR